MLRDHPDYVTQRRDEIILDRVLTGSCRRRGLDHNRIVWQGMQELMPYDFNE